MTTTYGLTNLGFAIPTVSDIREQINTALRAVFGSSIKLHNKSIFGQIVGIFAERIAKAWEATEAVNSSQDPDKATGAGLESVSSYTGTFRPPATYSVVTLTLTGTNATVVPQASRAATGSTGIIFETTAAGTIATVPAWTIATTYAVGVFVTNGGSVFECITAGAGSASFPGPLISAPNLADITDGVVHWAHVGLGTAAVHVPAKALDTGPITAVSRDITVMVSAVSGWNAVINVFDATEGADVATDAVLRVLREAELTAQGSSPIDAIRAELLDLADVVAITVFMNNTETVNVDGMPAKSVEALVRGPATPTAAFDQTIFDQLLKSVAAGIATHGSITGSSTDSSGNAQAMKFSRPTQVDIKVTITLIKDPTLYPSDGDAQVKKAIVDWGDAQATGKNAVSSRILANAFAVAGVLEVTSCLISINPAVPSVSTTIAISLRQLAVYDTSRITVVTSDGVP